METPDHDAVLDAGDMLCGELALLLRKELRALEPGKVLRVAARDRAAPQDIPAWCEVTGHALLRAEPPLFWIRRKADRSPS
ncbi:MAG: sulfurtransferase TusA family protein [Planctomycetota bacterium]|jgi:tRNA 2-thiouridine synthesizing protein A